MQLNNIGNRKNMENKMIDLQMQMINMIPINNFENNINNNFIERNINNINLIKIRRIFYSKLIKETKKN